MSNPQAHTFRVLFPFGGLGAGALGFKQAFARIGSATARFEIVGGIDFDDAASKDFVYLTGAPSLTADVGDLQPEELRTFAGDIAPDVVFFSPPCKGASGLLSEKNAKTAKYRKMNGLALTWLRLMFDTWTDRPSLVLLENVPRLKTRAAAMVKKLVAMLKKEGYVVSDGFHDCGELGGLAQHRRRYLLVARLPKKCPPLLYHPKPKRVRGCGEVLEKLPMPEDPKGGPLHKLPKLSWLNWCRLALIPAGGDWRDLPGVLEEGQARREKFKRHKVEQWNEPVGTIGGSGSNGVANIADPRPMAWFNGTMGVKGWGEPSGTVTGNARASTGAFSVADPRVDFAFDHAYRTLRWDEPSFTIAGGSYPGQGAYSVADPRLGCEPRAGSYGVLGWEDALGAITGHAKMDNGRFSVADPRKPPEFIPAIIAKDGTWHRPFTTLELAALQGLPTEVNGEPLKLAGRTIDGWRERIGNAVPPPAAQAIGEQMLIALLQAATSSFQLSSGAVWVSPKRSQTRRRSSFREGFYGAQLGVNA